MSIPMEDNTGEVKVDNLDYISNADVEVSKTLEVSNDCIAGPLKLFPLNG